MHLRGVICKGQRCSTFCFMKVDFLLTLFLLCCNHVILHSTFFFPSGENKCYISTMVCGLHYEHLFCSLFFFCHCLSMGTAFMMPLFFALFFARAGPCGSFFHVRNVPHTFSHRWVHVFFCAILFSCPRKGSFPTMIPKERRQSGKGFNAFLFVLVQLKRGKAILCALCLGLLDTSSSSVFKVAPHPSPISFVTWGSVLCGALLDSLLRVCFFVVQK